MLGAATACGVSPQLLLATDRTARNAYCDLAAEAIAYSQERDEALARMIISELARAMKRR